jgi:hypothetical protein
LRTKTEEAQSLSGQISKFQYEIESVTSTRRREVEDSKRGTDQLQVRLQ